MTEIKPLLEKFTNELRKIYGSNLKYVLLFGSYARGEEETGSDIDLLVVLDHFEDFWKELKKIENLAYHLTFDSGNKIVISAFPISLAQYQKGKSPFILNIKKEEVKIG